MAQLAVLIINIILLISKNSIEGDRNVNHRSLQSGSLQALQPINLNLGSRYQPRDYRRPLKTKKKMRRLKKKKKRQQRKKEEHRRQYDSTGKQTFRLCQPNFKCSFTN